MRLNHWKFKNIWLAAILLPVASWSSRGAVSTFIKIGDLTGGSLDVKHMGQIEVGSWFWGSYSQPSPLAGPAARRTTFSEFNFIKKVDKSSPGLLKACATGQHFDKAMLTIVNDSANRVEFYHFIMEDVVVTLDSLNAVGGMDDLLETVSLKYARVGAQYILLDLSGNPTVDFTFSWDAALNAPAVIGFPPAVPPVDSDGDGLPDDWEVAHKLDPNAADGLVDSDGDGANNLDEFVAGTDPRNKDNVFKAAFVPPPAGGNGTLSWSSATGKQYRILTTDKLGDPFTLYMTVPSAGDGSTSAALPANFGTSFFKIEVVP
jgi:type VI secretion system secreted protein Hcp